MNLFNDTKLRTKKDEETFFNESTTYAFHQMTEFWTSIFIIGIMQALIIAFYGQNFLFFILTRTNLNSFLIFMAWFGPQLALCVPATLMGRQEKEKVDASFHQAQVNESNQKEENQENHNYMYHNEDTDLKKNENIKQNGESDEKRWISSHLSDLKKRKKEKQFNFLLLVCFNHVFLSSFIGFICCQKLFCFDTLYKLFGDERKFVEFCILFFDFLFMTLIADFCFWVIHLILHKPFFFSKFHYIHHQVISPTPLTTFYVHPIEHLFANLFPILIGPLLLRPNPLLVIFWLTSATFSAVRNHSRPNKNYIFVNPFFHNLHHQLVRINFSISGLFDFLTYVVKKDENFRLGLKTRIQS